MEGKSKLTKEVVAQESRFILDSLIAAGQYSKEVPFEELRRLCEQSVSLRLLDYINFLERFGYITYDRNTHLVTITADGDRVVGGEKVAELVIDVVHHFRPILSRARAKEEPAPAGPSRPRRMESRELVDNRYEKLSTIGSGGIGSVYLARQVLLDREVALKEIRELFGFFTEPQRQEIIKRFDEEVRRAAKLSHPNIATIMDGNTTSDYPYVVSDYISGGSLRRIIKCAAAIPPELAVKVFLQILHGLRHAHSKGVVHRGLKPENILFDSTGNVRLTDFGMSRVVERDQAVIQHVYVGTGSVAYMAPELFNDPTSIGPQSDLYAVGIVLYEMLARKLPGRRSPMPTKLHPKLPKVVDDIFDRLTQDEREDRYKSVEEALEDFHKADASKDFLEPRGAVLFLQNPLEKLELKEEEEEEEEEPAEEENTGTDAEPVPAVAGTPKAAPPPAAAKPTPTPKPTPASAPATLEPVALDEAEPPIPTEATASAEEHIVDVMNEGGDGDSDEEEEKGGRRRKTRRPYSFQQRMKDRDK
jgi:serine/threonine protein kinase